MFACLSQVTFPDYGDLTDSRPSICDLTSDTRSKLDSTDSGNNEFLARDTRL